MAPPGSDARVDITSAKRCLSAKTAPRTRRVRKTVRAARGTRTHGPRSVGMSATSTSSDSRPPRGSDDDDTPRGAEKGEAQERTLQERTLRDVDRAIEELRRRRSQARAARQRVQSSTASTAEVGKVWHGLHPSPREREKPMLLQERKGPNLHDYAPKTSRNRAKPRRVRFRPDVQFNHHIAGRCIKRNK